MPRHFSLLDRRSDNIGCDFKFLYNYRNEGRNHKAES